MSRKVCILGVGKSGIAVARHCLSTGDEVTIYAGAGTESNRSAAQPFIDAGIPVHFDTEQVEGAYDLCVTSPGIPQVSAFYRSGAAASRELISELEFAWRLSPEDWIAISGTNGKTTTTALVSHILESCGYPAYACGNIGKTATESVEHRRVGETLVAEVSSFQIASIVDFRPKVAVLLNITPDHLRWHGSHEAYVQAKLRLFENLGTGQTAVICDEVPDSDELVEHLRAGGVRTITVGRRRQADCAFQGDDGVLYVVLGDETPQRLVGMDELQIKGAHNAMNALVAAVTAISVGCDIADVCQALRSFSPLEHRIEPAGEVDGVAFYNDSKATNVDATLKALTAFDEGKVILLLGGRDKGTDLGALVDACEGVCRSVICYGEGGPRFYEAFADSSTQRLSVTSMKEAFDEACGMASPGDVVLLSPACASFDEFDSFEQRGDVFKDLVQRYRTRND